MQPTPPVTIATRGIPGVGYGTHAASFYVRLRGNAVAAQIETAPDHHPDPATAAVRAAEWVPESVPGQVIVNAEGVVTVRCAAICEQAERALERAFALALRDARMIEPDGLRYRIGFQYVALDHAEATVLAKVAGASITVAPAQVVHVGSGWALWSDGELTTSSGLPKWTRELRGVSPDAAALANQIRGSDSGSPGVGWAAVFAVEKILGSAPVTHARQVSAYYGLKVDALTVRLVGGEEVVWWRYQEGYGDGYACELHGSLEALRASLMPPATAYVPPQGQLWEPCPLCGTEPVLMPLLLCEQCYPALSEGR